MYNFTPEQIAKSIEAEVAEWASWAFDLDRPATEEQLEVRREHHRANVAKGNLGALKEHLGVHAILVYRKEEAEAALTKLAKKAKQYGTEAITWTWGDTFQEERRTESGRKIKVAYQDLILNTLEAPRVGKFEFVARLEITPTGVIIDCVPGESLPKHFRDNAGQCEHCQQNRARKDLFVVRGEDGTLVQVGRTCLRDYMGTDAPGKVAATFRFEREFKAWGEEFAGGRKIADSTEELLAVTSASIRMRGWVSKSAPESAGTPTAYHIGVWFQQGSLTKLEAAEKAALKAALTEGDWQLAKDAIAWVLGNGDDSEYMDNLRVILAAGAVEGKRRGYACSAVAAYQRELGKLEARARQAEKAALGTSKAVGSVGERLQLELTVRDAKGFNGDYGYSILYKMEDAAGNVFSWFSSGSTKLDIGQTYKLKATIKGHGEYQGVVETQLSRGKVE